LRAIGARYRLPAHELQRATQRSGSSNREFPDRPVSERQVAVSTGVIDAWIVRRGWLRL
jgi:hypothetical protein